MAAVPVYTKKYRRAGIEVALKNIHDTGVMLDVVTRIRPDVDRIHGPAEYARRVQHFVDRIGEQADWMIRLTEVK